MKIVYSPRAVSDLAAIADYLTERSLQGALPNAVFKARLPSSGAFARLLIAWLSFRAWAAN